MFSQFKSQSIGYLLGILYESFHTSRRISPSITISHITPIIFPVISQDFPMIFLDKGHLFAASKRARAPARNLCEGHDLDEAEWRCGNGFHGNIWRFPKKWGTPKSPILISIGSIGKKTALDLQKKTALRGNAYF